MSDPLYVRVSYEWNDRYNEPPVCQSRVLAEVFIPYTEWPQPTPPEIQSVWKPGSGYSIYVTFLNEPPRQMPPEKLASIRMKRLRRRVEKKYPLLADEIIQEEIAKNPDYYAGITRADLVAGREAIIAAEIAQLEHARQMVEARKGLAK